MQPLRSLIVPGMILLGAVHLIGHPSAGPGPAAPGARRPASPPDSVPNGWVRHFGTSALTSRDDAKFVTVDRDGNSYVTGESEGATTGYDIATVKYSPAGAEEWVRRFDGPNHLDDVPRGIALDSAGNVYVAGGDGNYSVTLKYSPAGDSLWAAATPVPADFVSITPYAMKADPNGGVLVCGQRIVGTYLSSRWEYFLVKYTPGGDTAWMRTFPSPQYSFHPPAIDLGASGDVFFAGVYDPLFFPARILLEKFAPSGDVEWSRTYAGPGSRSNYAAGIAVDHAGDVYVTGGMQDSSGVMIATLKYSSAGDSLWAAVYGSAALPPYRNNAPVAISLSPDSAIVVAGTTVGILPGPDLLLLKYSSGGDTLWTRQYSSGVNPYGFDYSDQPHALSVDGAGRITVAEVSEDTGYANRISTIRYAPDGTLGWVRTELPPGYPTLGGIAVAPSGGAVVAGGDAPIISPLYPDGDFVTTMYSEAGDSLWFQRFKGPGLPRETLAGMVADPAQNLYVAGLTTEPYNITRMHLVKFAPSGDTLWSREQRYTGAGRLGIAPAGIGIDGSGYLYVTATKYDSSQYPGIRSTSCCVLKYTQDGDTVWTRTLAGQGIFNDPFEMTVLPAGGLYVVLDNERLVRLSANGDILWEHAGGQMMKIAVDRDDNVYTEGDVVYSVYDSIYTVIKKFSPTGDSLWGRKFHDQYNDEGRGIAVDSAGNVSVLMVTSVGGYGYVYETMTYSGAGDSLWFRRYDGPVPGQAYPASIAIDGMQHRIIYGTGGIIAYGASGDSLWSSAVPVTSDAHLTFQGEGRFVTADEAGTVIDVDARTTVWSLSGDSLGEAVYTYPTPSTSDVPAAIIANDDGSLYVGANSSSYPARWSEWTVIRYDQIPVTTVPRGARLPGIFRLDQNYPNPFNPATRISYSLPEMSRVTLRVYNTLGQLVSTVVDGVEPAGERHALWNGSNAASGVYFLRLEASPLSNRGSPLTQVRKMLLIR